MKEPVIVLLCLLAAGAWGADPRPPMFSLVSHGRPSAEIVVAPAEPDPPLAFAAQELQRYVQAMSGAELSLVRTPSEKPAIVLAVRSFSPNEEPSADPRERDRYRISIDAQRLTIEGASSRAVLYGVYDVLERLGCAWCVPGDDTIPERETIEIAALQSDQRPAFQYRMLLDFPMLSVDQTIAIADWIAKNRLNWIHECPNAHGEPTAWFERREQVVPELKKRGLQLILGGHTMHTWVPETHFVLHPEWFAYNAGERKPPAPCITNPDMTAELIKELRRFLDRCPEVEVVDLWHPDSEVFCHCARCTRGVLSEEAKDKPPRVVPADVVQSAYVITYIEFINRVAAAVAQSHPKVMLSPLIYSQTDRAMPDGSPALADNILIGLAHFLRDSYRPLIGEPKSAINQRLLGNDLTWMAKAKHSYIYEYYNCWIAPYIYPGAQVIVRDLLTLEQLQVQGVSSDMYGYSPINMYVAARAFWSPNLTWSDAVRDFCLRYYGAAGEAMSENQLRLENGIFGRSGYQASGARDPEKWETPPTAGLYLQEQRPGQIRFLKGLIETTHEPVVKARLERALQPWTQWNKEPRFWAFPEFARTTNHSAAAPDAILLNGRKQLFLDDYLIASVTNVARATERAQKFPGNPVLWPSESWEPPLALLYGSVLREGTKYKMWYKSGLGVAYAESDDGIQWKKPRLDSTLVKGQPSNLLFTKKGIMEGSEEFPYHQELFGVHRDDRDPDPSRRYKMGFLDIDWKYDGPDGLPWRKNQRRGLGVAASPDGLRWKLVDSWATSAIVDGATHWMFDPRLQKYVLYGRTLAPDPAVMAAWSTNTWFKQYFSGRAVARVESSDFVQWNFTKPVTAPVVMTADLQDPPGTELYSLKVFPHEGIYIGLVQVLRSTPDDSTLDIQLAVSRDGIRFTRVADRGTFLALGGIGSWDRFNISLANNDPIGVEDRLRFYYSGRLYRHSPYEGPDKGEEKSGIGFATIQRDRYVALQASFDGGEIVTKPVQLQGRKLHINAKADFGEIIVEVLGMDDRLLATSKPIQRDSLNLPVEWNVPADWPLEARVKLRLKLKNARLFALWCED